MFVNRMGIAVSNSHEQSRPGNVAGFPGPASDETLMRRAQAGDREAFDLIVRRHKNRVYNVVFRYVGNHEDTQDIVQEVFVRAYRGRAGYREQARVTTWLHTIAANLARNRLRDQSRKGRDKGGSLDRLAEDAPAAAQTALKTEHSPRQAAEYGELEAALRACLERLPEIFRMAFVLRTYEELDYDELAEALDVPRGTVKSRLNGARGRLRDCLKASGVL